MMALASKKASGSARRAGAAHGLQSRAALSGTRKTAAKAPASGARRREDPAPSGNGPATAEALDRELAGIRCEDLVARLEGAARVARALGLLQVEIRINNARRKAEEAISALAAEAAQ